MLSSFFSVFVIAESEINDFTLYDTNLISENRNNIIITEDELTKPRTVDGEFFPEFKTVPIVQDQYKNNIEQGLENAAEYDPNKEYEVGDIVLFSEDVNEDGKAELFMTATYKGKCLRYWENISGNKSYMYTSAAATSYTTWNQSGQTFYTEEVWLTSTGVYRYKSINTWQSSSGTSYGYGWFEKTSADNWKVCHTYSYSAHSGSQHRDYCDFCGGYYNSYYSAFCYSCCPGHIYYNANGGSGAPSTQTVTSSTAYISSTKPTRFKYKFRGWNTSSSASSGSYYPGNSISISANSSKTLYAVWESYKNLFGSSDSDSTQIYIGGTMGYFRFKPSETATYVFQSTNSSGDTYGYLYNSNGTQLSYNDDSGEGSNFKISYNLTEGTIYYYAVKWYDTSKTGFIYVNLKQQYDISYDANGGTGAPSSQTKLHGDSITLSSTKPVRDLWQFNGWATSNNAINAQYQAGGSYSANGNQTLYAVWGYPTGSCGTDATWTFKENGLYITGTGDMSNYANDTSAPWHKYSDYIQTIQIDDGITSIGDYAFSGCNKITSIELPTSVTSIGKYAFSNCTALENINIPSGVTAINDYTFNNCKALKIESLPDGVTTIGEYAFSGCESIAAMVLPETITSIGTYAFSECSNLESINVPQKVTIIEPYTFNGNTKLQNTVISDNVTTIKEFAFSGCSSFTDVVIPKSVTTIERGAFSNCTLLKTATIPDNVITIGTSIFAYVKDNITIKCYIDTAAYNYANDNDISYELMSWGVLEKPTFSKVGIIGGATISISAPKGEIYYTTDGSEPTINSTHYDKPFTTKKNFTVKAIAVADGWTNSDVAEYETGVTKVSAPYASVASNSRIVKGTKIELYCETDGATILCTTDGNVPTESDIYSAPIEITENTTIYAMAVKEGMLNSALTVFNYEISNAEDTPTVTTLDAVDITETSAKVSAEVDDNNGVLSDVQFVYYEKNNSSAKYTIKADENYSAVLTGLTPGTEYWYQVKAQNEKGWSYGYIKSFTTDLQGVVKPTSIELNPTYLSMNVGKKKTILATVLPLSADSRDVYWSSEDKAVATVDKNGVVSAIGLGNTRIKATTVSGRLVAYCNVDVISSKPVGEFDFSEHNMITNSSNYDLYGYDHSVNDGGNALMASAYLARWDGAVLEGNDPYPNSLSEVKYKEIEPDYHVQNIIYLPYRTGDLDNNEIKNAIMKYGAVYTALKINYDYFDKSQTNYCLPKNVNRYNGGHAINIVGWDDNYSRMNFVSPPEADGAFICKNSWGTDSGENGYFYVSYYDKYIARAICGDFNAVFYDIESNDNYNKIYQYDYLGPVASYPMGSKKLYAANVFPENGKSLEENEKLKAVSFYNYAPGTAYEIYVVKNYTDKNSLKNLGSPVKTGVSEYAGYCTVNLDKAIDLQKGTRFAVVVKYTSYGDNTQIFIETPINLNVNGKSIPHSSNAKANPDESYISKNGKNWSDLTNIIANTNLCIKAFTETDDNAATLQAIDNIGRIYEDDTVYSIEELITKGCAVNQEFIDFYGQEKAELFSEDEEDNFGFVPPSIIPDLNTNNNYSEGAALPVKYDLRQEECMTAVKNQGKIGSCWSFATYSSLESAIKKASYLSNKLSGDGLNQATEDATSIELNKTGIIMALGNDEQLKATLLPFDTTAEIIWETSNAGVVSVSSHGLAKALGVGNAYITAKTADGSVSAECAVTVTAPVKVDSITINNTEQQITSGDNLMMEYSVFPENAGDKKILWTVDDSSVASIDEYGILTAKSGGKVQVTAFSSDKTVSATYLLNVDDGCECNIDITENDLGIYGNNIFGSVSATITNKTEKTTDVDIYLAIYDSENKLISNTMQTKTLAVGDNNVEFSKLYVSGISDSTCVLKLFVWEKDTLKPMAMFKTAEIK